jgi:predicted metal-dependent peptidase
MREGFSEARLRLMAGRIVAQNRWPYMSGVLFALKPVEVSKEEVPTLAVDSGWRLYFCKEFVTEQPVEVLATALLHEALHCVLDHMGRFEIVSRNQTASGQVWNLCGDAHINKTLDLEQMPWGDFQPVRFDTLEKYGVLPEDTTEAAHNKILEHLKENQAELSETQDCGSVATGGKRDYEVSESEANSTSISRPEQDGIKDVLAIDINRRREAGDQVGDALLKWASSRLNPIVDWKKQLRFALRSSYAVASGKKDYSYSRPARKQGALLQAGMNVIVPALRNPSPPNVAILIDTSGSISRTELEMFGAELFGILKSIGSRTQVDVIGCDTRVAGPFKVRKPSEISDLNLRGGGGTDLRIGVDFAIKNLAPDILVIATDGETPWHHKAPNPLKSYIGLFTTEQGQKNAPKWITPILIN